MSNNLFAKLIPEVFFSFNDHPFRKPSFVLYFCGCPHRCKNCHSPELQDMNYFGCMAIDCQTLCDMVSFYYDIYRKYVKGLVLLGGDPLVYTEFLKAFLKKVKESFNLEVVLYTGYLFEEIDKDVKDYVDIIIDGKYVEELRTGKFPASSNQRVFIKNESNEWFDITSSFIQE